MDAAQPAAAEAAGLPATVRPVGVSGAEYRRQWNKLNKARIRKSQREWYKNHPEKHKKFPKSVRDKWRPLNKKKHRARYYSDWKKRQTGLRGGRQTKQTLCSVLQEQTENSLLFLAAA
jgi:hypothetical protein